MSITRFHTNMFCPYTIISCWLESNDLMHFYITLSISQSLKSGLKKICGWFYSIQFKCWIHMNDYFSLHCLFWWYSNNLPALLIVYFTYVLGDFPCHKLHGCFLVCIFLAFIIIMSWGICYRDWTFSRSEGKLSWIWELRARIM